MIMITSGDMINWYAVQAKNHNEARVLYHLTQKTIPTFFPLVEVIRRYRSCRVARLEPLFPGYLFVQLERIDCNPGCWNVVRWTPGVKSILGTEDIPVPVPDGVIEAIRDRIKDFGFIRPGLRFQPNSRVRITQGPLVGLEAIFDRLLSRSGRVSVLMEILGQQRGVEVDVVDLELV